MIPRILFLATILVLDVQNALANVRMVTAINDDAPPSGILTTATTISSLLSNDLRFHAFEQPITVTISGEQAWGASATQPTSDAAALLDDRLDTGLLNPGTYTVQWGRQVGLSEVFFILDGDTSRFDGLTVRPVDANGAPIGDYLLDVPDIVDEIPLIRFRLNRESGGTLPDFHLSGILFALEQFTGTTGDLALTEGLRVEDNVRPETGKMDPFMIAIASGATLPQPDPIQPSNPETFKVVSTAAGTSFQFAKRGALFHTQPQMPGPGAYWPTLVKMASIPDFPYEWALYFSTDHSNTGGIYLYLCNGRPSDPGNWISYNDAVAAGDFDYLTTKPRANPIFRDTRQGGSTETPHVNIIDGVAYMTYHNNGAGFNQSTLLATSNDGVNFTRLNGAADSVILDYDPATAPGDGHTGYFRWGINPFAGVPYPYVGYSLHGGTANYHLAMWGSHNAISWTRLQIFNPVFGGINVETGRSLLWSHLDPNMITDLGNGEYLAVIPAGTRSAGGDRRVTELYEVFLAADGKTVTRMSRKILTIGSDISPDGGEVAQPAFARIGDTWHMIYQGATSDAGVNTLMGATGFIDKNAPLPTPLDPTAQKAHWNPFTE